MVKKHAAPNVTVRKHKKAPVLSQLHRARSTANTVVGKQVWGLLYAGVEGKAVHDAFSRTPDRHWQFCLDDNQTTWPQSIAKEQAKRELVPLINSVHVSDEAIRSGIFDALYELLSKMPLLPEGHVLATNEETANAAAAVLNHLRHYKQAPPKVFAHGGDAVVFSWDMDEISRYLTVIGEELNLQEINKRSKAMSDSDFSLETDDDRQRWLEILGGAPNSSTMVANGS